MKKIMGLLKYSILKTIVFNFKYFTFFQAIKFPVLITRNVYLKQLRGNIILKQSRPKTGDIIIGNYGVGIFDEKDPKQFGRFLEQ